jgi:histidyl-tRNA synthetase
LGIEWVRDHRLVRGFDYYTRTVFEFVPPGKGSQGTLLGGGRYDGLVELLGGPATPGAGFGMGLERALASSSLAAAPAGDLVYVVAMEPGEAAFGPALVACRDLRKAGFRGELGAEGKSANSSMRAANSAGARAAVLVSASGLTVKDMRGGADLAVPAGDTAGLIRVLKGLLAVPGQ